MGLRMSLRILGSLALLAAFVTCAQAQDTPAPTPRPDAGFPLLSLRIGEGLQDNKEQEVKVSLNGWMRVEYNFGNRFPDAFGNDELGVSKMALKTTATYQDFDFIAVLGATIMSDQPVDTSFKDLFVVWHKVGGTDAQLKVGAQPILFGLKPNGYPGDRSIQPSVEFGGAGAFAVSNQAGPSILAEYPLAKGVVAQAGAFDTAQTTFGTPGVQVDGSRLYRNYFGQVRFTDIGVEGLSGVVGYEGLYIGGADNHVEPIVDVGVMYSDNKYFDISFEFIALDKHITLTTDDERYYVAEFTGHLNDQVSGYVDYAIADQLNNRTLRVGAMFEVNKHVTVHAEVSHDIIDNGPDLDSGGLRLTFHF
jgi:hypothetical protein